MTGLFEDFRYGFRALAKYRRFTAVAVLSLALGMGANTTIFTLINAILLRPLPVQDPARLAVVYVLDGHNPGYWGVSMPNFQDYRDRNAVFSALTLYVGVGLNYTSGQAPRQVMGQLVSANYFTAVGVNPVVGRGFLPEEETSAVANPVAVISNRFWRQEFGGDPALLSRTLSLNGRPYRITGVAPPGFNGLNLLTATDIWVPMALYPELLPSPAYVKERRYLRFSMAGRLKPGVSMVQAQTAMNTLTADLAREYPKDNADRRVLLAPASDAAIPPPDRADIRRAAAVLAVLSAVVLIIACGNLANLLLTRAAGRTREIAVRLALGASRGQLIRQLLVESGLLALLGGAAGLGLAILARDLLWSMRPPLMEQAAVPVGIDFTILAYNFALALAVTLLFALTPALRATRPDLAQDLKERSGQGAHSGGWNARSVLVMLQVAFAVIALVGAGLFVRSLRRAMEFDPGYDSGHMGFVVFNVANQHYTPERGRQFQRRVLERAHAIPGVAGATLSTDWPFHVGLSRTMAIAGRNAPGQIILTSVVWPGYFDSVGIPLLRGRDFNDGDAQGTPHVAIVNQNAANLYWPGEDPVGKRVRFYGENFDTEVIGVARTVNYQAIGEKPRPFIYLSLHQYYFPMSVLLIRTQGEPDGVLASVRREVQGLDRGLLLQGETANTTLRSSLWAQRLSASLLAVFGMVALLLAAIGIYGVVSYLVTNRVREFGIRMALGATANDVQMMLLREGVRLVAIGVVAGLGVALVGSQLVEGMLFGVSPRDAVTFVFVPSILTLVAVAACWFPALRATRVDPMTALREE